FARGLADRSLFVMGADYGSRLQLQKIAMLDVVDAVVVNKSDLPTARTAASEIEQRLRANRRGQQVMATTAKRHRDGGVDRLFEMLLSAPREEASENGETEMRTAKRGKKQER